MHRLGTYLPQDRLRALIRGEALPSHTRGSAILADISGFTPLTEKLTRTLGPRKGVEALSQQINEVFGALIDQVEGYGGSIISFAGDSIIGWFEEADSSAALRAVTCAQGMQAAMHGSRELSLKVIITTGPSRRRKKVIVAGDKDGQAIQINTGNTDYAATPIPIVWDFQSQDIELGTRGKLKEIDQMNVFTENVHLGQLFYRTNSNRDVDWKSIRNVTNDVEEVDNWKGKGNWFNFKLTGVTDSGQVKLLGFEFPEQSISTMENANN